MAIFNFPTAFGDGLVVRGVPIFQAHQGAVFYVGNNPTLLDGEATASAGANGNFSNPVATITQAIALCVANRGDIIMVRPGHTQTMATAAAIAMSKAGVALIGMGTGANRPTLNYTATAATMTVSGAGCTISNFLITNGIDQVVSTIVVSAADVTIMNCEHRDITGGAQIAILTTAGATRLRVQNWLYDGAAGADAAIAIVGGDGIILDGLDINGSFDVAAIDIVTTATTNLIVRNSLCHIIGEAQIFLIDTVTGSTGFMGPNIMIRLSVNGANINEVITGATFVYLPDIGVVNLANETVFSQVVAGTIGDGMTMIGRVASTDA